VSLNPNRFPAHLAEDETLFQIICCYCRALLLKDIPNRAFMLICKLSKYHCLMYLVGVLAI
jgi:hypothetical protein